MFVDFLNWLQGLALVMPLELFVLIGSIIEELVSPIPSPLITTTTGLIVATRSGGWLILLYLAAIATVAKTFGSLLIYFIADKAEDFLIIKLGPRLGLDHQKIEALGKRFSDSWWDYLTLTLIRIIPIFPTFVVSAAAGVIKLRLRVYFIATLIGGYFRSLFFMFLGYAGLTASNRFLNQINDMQTWLEVLAVIIALGGLGWIYWKRKGPTR